MSKEKLLTSAILLVELCKQINKYKYIKRMIIDIRIKTRSLPKYRLTRIKISSLLTPEEILFTNDIKIMQKHLYKVAERILKHNNLTVKDINAEDFELGSRNLIDGSCEILSPNGDKIYFYNISTGELMLYTTPEEEEKAKIFILNIKPLPNMQDYIQFMNLPPF